jgi:hypothetical protein
MLMSRRGVLVCIAAMLVRRRGVLIRFGVPPMFVVVRGLAVVVRSIFVVRSRFVMMFARRMFCFSHVGSSPNVLFFRRCRRRRLSMASITLQAEQFGLLLLLFLSEKTSSYPALFHIELLCKRMCRGELYTEV